MGKPSGSATLKADPSMQTGSLTFKYCACVWAAVRFCEQWVSPKSLPGLGLGEAWGSGAFPSGNVERRRPFSTAPSRGGSSLLRWRKEVSLPATHMERNRTGSCPQLHPRKQPPAVTDVPNFPVDLLRVIRRTPPPHLSPAALCLSSLPVFCNTPF